MSKPDSGNLSHLLNAELKRRIYDAIDAPLDCYEQHSDHHWGLTKADLEAIGHYVGVDLFYPDRMVLSWRIGRVIGLFDDTPPEEATSRRARLALQRRQGLKAIHEYVTTHPPAGTPSKCERLRTIVAESSVENATAQSGYAHSTVRKHAYGHCDCESAVAPVAVTGNGGAISESVCVDWRRRVRHDGDSRRGIAAAAGHSKSLVAKHVRGDCPHDEDRLAEPPVITNGATLSVALCAEIRERSADGESGASIARDERMPSPRTVRRHANGECPHDHGECQ